MGLHPSCYISDEESYDQEPFNREVVQVNVNIHTQESAVANLNADEDMLVAEVVDAPCGSDGIEDEANKGKVVEANKGKVVATTEPKNKGKKGKLMMIQ